MIVSYDHIAIFLGFVSLTRLVRQLVCCHVSLDSIVCTHIDSDLLRLRLGLHCGIIDFGRTIDGS